VAIISKADTKRLTQNKVRYKQYLWLANMANIQFGLSPPLMHIVCNFMVHRKLNWLHLDRANAQKTYWTSVDSWFWWINETTEASDRQFKIAFSIPEAAGIEDRNNLSFFRMKRIRIMGIFGWNIWCADLCFWLRPFQFIGCFWWEDRVSEKIVLNRPWLKSEMKKCTQQ